MSPVTNSRVLFNEYPQGYPDPEKTVVFDKSQTIDPDTVPLNGGVFVKVIVFSIDPYMRNKMRKPENSPYASNYKIGEPIDTYGIGKVVRSENSAFSAGDHLYGTLPFVEYAVLQDVEKYKKVEKSGRLPWSAYVGVCGMPGKTAYHGWMAYAHPHVKKGDTLFVTTGAGTVGSLVIQLAKLDGLKVIASAGSDEKVKFMLDCGADVAFNYKTTSTKDVLDKHGPINVYWDHVGGEVLDLALEAADKFSHFILCGMISGYNQKAFTPIKNIADVLFKSITMQGFVVGNLEAQFGAEFNQVIPPKVASGEIKYKEDVKHGLESAGQALLEVQTGRNTGKAVIVVSDD